MPVQGNFPIWIALSWPKQGSLAAWRWSLQTYSLPHQVFRFPSRSPICPWTLGRGDLAGTYKVIVRTEPLDAEPLVVFLIHGSGLWRDGIDSIEGWRESKGYCAVGMRNFSTGPITFYTVKYFTTYGSRAMPSYVQIALRGRSSNHLYIKREKL